MQYALQKSVRLITQLWQKRAISEKKLARKPSSKASDDRSNGFCHVFVGMYVRVP